MNRRALIHRLTLLTLLAGALLAGPSWGQDPDSSPFGVCSHLARDSMLDDMHGIGIQWFRIDIDWNHVEPQRGQYDWRDIDRTVAWAEANDARILGSIAYAPQWASGSTDQAAGLANVTEFPLNNTS